MFREETKRWFRTSRMHGLALHSVRSCIGDFFFGLRMAVLDLYYGIRGIVRGRWFMADLYARLFAKELYYAIKDRDMGRFRRTCKDFWEDISLSYTWDRDHFRP